MCKILLSLHRALLGEVTPNLRAVTVRAEGSLIQAICYFADPPGEEEREAIQVVHMNVLADFTETDVVSFEIVELPLSKKVPSQGATFVYARKED